MGSRLPELSFVVLAGYSAIHFPPYYSQLPDVVASHFNGQGVANGWQTKPAFFTVFVGVSVLAGVIGFGIPRIISAMPPQLINLPNKQYWLAQDRLAETQAFLNNYFAWFGCAVFLVIILIFDYAIKSNLDPQNRPDISRVWYILAGFLAFITIWIIRLLTRFLRTPQEEVRS